MVLLLFTQIIAMPRLIDGAGDTKIPNTVKNVYTVTIVKKNKTRERNVVIHALYMFIHTQRHSHNCIGVSACT